MKVYFQSRGSRSTVVQGGAEAAIVQRDESSDLGSWSTAMAAAAAVAEGLAPHHSDDVVGTGGVEHSVASTAVSTDFRTSEQRPPSPPPPPWAPSDLRTSPYHQPLDPHAGPRTTSQPPSPPPPPPRQTASEVCIPSPQDSPPRPPSSLVDPVGQPPSNGRVGAGGGHFAWLFGTPPAVSSASAAPQGPEEADSADPPVTLAAATRTPQMPQLIAEALTDGLPDALTRHQGGSFAAAPLLGAAVPAEADSTFDPSVDRNGLPVALQEPLHLGASSDHAAASDVLSHPSTSAQPSHEAPLSWEASFSTAAASVHPSSSSEYPTWLTATPAVISDPVSRPSSSLLATQEANPAPSWMAPAVPAEAPSYPSWMTPKPDYLSAEVTSTHPWLASKPDPFPSQSWLPPTQAASSSSWLSSTSPELISSGTQPSDSGVAPSSIAPPEPSQLIKHDLILVPPPMPPIPPKSTAEPTAASSLIAEPASPDSLPPLAPSQRTAQQKQHVGLSSVASNYLSASSSYLSALADDSRHAPPPSASTAAYPSAGADRLAGPWPSASTAASPTVSKPSASFLDAYLDNMLRLDDVGQAPAAGSAGANIEDAADPDGSNPSDQQPDGGHRGSSAGSIKADHLDGCTEGDLAEPDGGSVGVGAEAPGGKATAALGLPPRPPHGPTAASASSHKRVDSTDSFASGAAGQFALLHQHIDELTEEKLGLQRGLAKQQRLAEGLAEENEALVAQYNAQARVVEELNKKVQFPVHTCLHMLFVECPRKRSEFGTGSCIQIQRYEDELEAQVLALEHLSMERESARAAAHEAHGRATGLAAEVVSLEQAGDGKKSRIQSTCLMNTASTASSHHGWKDGRGHSGFPLKSPPCPTLRPCSARSARGCGRWRKASRAARRRPRRSGASLASRASWPRPARTSSG